MNRLPRETHKTILNMVLEGMSQRAASRTTGVAKKTVAKLFYDAGR